jgi:dehydrogenase/reductase SDR family protein 12
MHPGWAATPGVDEAIPGFAKTMEGRLRTPLQGADTILWLLGTNKDIESGELYFDRKKVSPHYFWFTKKSEKQSLVLENLLKNSLSGV